MGPCLQGSEHICSTDSEEQPEQRVTSSVCKTKGSSFHTPHFHPRGTIKGEPVQNPTSLAFPSAGFPHAMASEAAQRVQKVTALEVTALLALLCPRTCSATCNQPSGYQCPARSISWVLNCIFLSVSPARHKKWRQRPAPRFK